jgi:hypothetical protein
LNDGNKKKNLSSSRNKLIKSELTPRNGTGQSTHYNPLQILDNNTLKTMNYFKGTMIKDCKDLDVEKNGSISKEETISMLMKNIPDINHDLAQQIVEHYFITDQIDYMKFIALLIKGCKNCFIRKKHYFNFSNILLGKKDNLTASNSRIYQNSSIKKNMNLKSVIQKQKDKKFEIIKKAEIESVKIEDENKRYININVVDEKENFFENVAVIGGDNTLREIQQTSKIIVQYFNEALEILEKYKDKIKIEKAIKYFKKICNAANQRDVEEMRKCRAEFQYYCDFHYRY